MRGTVLGLNTLDNKATTVDSSKTDGTQIPYGIFADDIDATLEDKKRQQFI